MCVLAFAWNAHPHWRLVAIANRDEFHARPAGPLARWNDGSGIAAGRDLAGGGTWLGVGADRRFVALTNLRSDTPPDPAAPSRGALVNDLLGGVDPASVALDRYNPFSLVCVDEAQATLLTSRHGERLTLEPGLHGLTNGPHDRPWPKLGGLMIALDAWLTHQQADFAPLFAALRDESVPPGAFDEATALPAFIRNPVYGTRCSTVVVLDRDGRGEIVERRFDAAGEATGETRLALG
jgi:uncharacterized protein with NRDE domain